MRYLNFVAALLLSSAFLFAADIPETPIAPGTYLLVYKRSDEQYSYMWHVRLTFTEQADKSLAVTSEPSERMNPPASPTPVTQRDGKFTFTLVYSTAPTDSHAKTEVRTFHGEPDLIFDNNNAAIVVPGAFRGEMSSISSAGGYIGDFLLYRLPGK